MPTITPRFEITKEQYAHAVLELEQIPTEEEEGHRDEQQEGRFQFLMTLTADFEREHEIY